MAIRILFSMVMILSLKAIAADSVVTCNHADSSSLQAQIKLSPLGPIDSITVDGSSLYPRPSLVNTSGILTESEFKSSSFLQAFVPHLKQADLKGKVLSLNLIVSQEMAPPTASLLDIVDRVADDGAGLVLLTIRDNQSNVLDRIAFLGWGGFFNNCQ